MHYGIITLLAHSCLTDKCSQLRQSSSLLFRWIWRVFITISFCS